MNYAQLAEDFALFLVVASCLYAGLVCFWYVIYLWRKKPDLGFWEYYRKKNEEAEKD